MVCALNGVAPWARYTSKDPELLHWTLADRAFQRPETINFRAGAGPLFNPIPNPLLDGTGPTHMINGNLGTGFYLGVYDEERETFNITSTDTKGDMQFIDIGNEDTAFGHGSANWCATSNDFASGESRLLWVCWLASFPGAMSLVRSVTLDHKTRRLVSYPVAEYETLRNATYYSAPRGGLALPPGALQTLPVPTGGYGGSLDVLVSFTVPASGGLRDFGVAVRAPPDTTTGAAQAIWLSVADADAAGVRNVSVSGTLGSLPATNSTLLFPGESLDVRVLVDRMIVEVYVMHGRIAYVHADEKASERYIQSNTSVHLFNKGTASVSVSNATVFGMGCGWRSDLPHPKA
eukprot:Hpha_TRINITY_DN10174_c0_g1::TRINITY_DN10174_c0_g1_i1::g.131574::m.131574